ncbi:unnamed protein product [Moneuplotes crassus]|uniref:Uncharacterized protein n=1 Tax=Euplotes crassus TaxID=5936 RepID=A0AAD2CW90_EUPCR|nr:unnamed protein product [Moneuplotes crassus]
MLKIYLLCVIISLISCQFVTEEFTVSNYQHCDYTASPYEEYGTTCRAHDSECDTEEGYRTYYQESCDDGYSYSEECDYEDLKLYDGSTGSCQTIESFSGYSNTCIQTFTDEDETSQQTTEENCYDSDGGYDHSVEVYKRRDRFGSYDYFSQYEYFYVEDRRNLSGSCITDTSRGIENQCSKSYQYSIDSTSELLWTNLDECAIPPIYEGCFCNCTISSDDPRSDPPICRNVGTCNDEEYRELQDNFEDIELTADACGCKPNASGALPQDNQGFIQLFGAQIHCPTVCWEQENIYDLLEDTEIIPIPRPANLTREVVSP